MSEHDEQAAVFMWAALQSGQHPELALLYANVNQGKRSYGAAHHMREEGMRAGVPDMCMPKMGYYPRNGNVVGNALYIEMKMPGNKPTALQQWWIEHLREAGNRVEVCYSADEAIAVIKDYLGIEE